MKNPSIISIYRFRDSNTHRLEYLVDVFGIMGGGFRHCFVASAEVEDADIDRALSAVVRFIGMYGLPNKSGFHLFAPPEIMREIPTWLGGTSENPPTAITLSSISRLLERAA
jgi:hypothetical protein